MIDAVVLKNASDGTVGTRPLSKPDLTADRCGEAKYVPTGMVRIDREEEGWRFVPERVAAFCIDAEEVTIAKYMMCVARGRCDPPSTGRPVDSFNQYTPLDCTLDTGASRAQHPMICVNFYEATKYCEWRGGRLPRSTEWLRAASNAAGYNPEVGEPPRLGSLDVALLLSAPHDTAVVGTHPGDVSAFGVKDMLGNAKEWAVPRRGVDRLIHRPHVPSPSACAKGLVALDPTNLGYMTFVWEIGYQDVLTRSNTIGFRCAYDGAPAIWEGGDLSDGSKSAR